MVVYEDLPTGLRGQSAYTDLQSFWHPKPVFNEVMWHSNLLGDPLFREQAVLDACDANLIILSVHGRTNLPPELVEWLKRWTDEKDDRQYIICLLLDQDAETDNDHNLVTRYMAGVAKAAEADLCTSVKVLQLPGMEFHNDASPKVTPLRRWPDASVHNLKREQKFEPEPAPQKNHCELSQK